MRGGMECTRTPADALQRVVHFEWAHGCACLECSPPCVHAVSGCSGTKRHPGRLRVVRPRLVAAYPNPLRLLPEPAPVCGLMMTRLHVCVVLVHVLCALCTNKAGVCQAGCNPRELLCASVSWASAAARWRVTFVSSPIAVIQRPCMWRLVKPRASAGCRPSSCLCFPSGF